jgi:hypothetical protein
VVNNTVLYVTTSLDPEVTVPLGYDLGDHGLVDEPRRYPTIRPDELATRLDELVGPPTGDNANRSE